MRTKLASFMLIFIHKGARGGRPEISTDSVDELSPLRKQRVRNSRREQQGKMGTGSTYWLCLGANGAGVPALMVPGGTGAWEEAERSLIISSAGNPWSQGALSDGLCKWSVLFWSHSEQQTPVSLDILSAVLHPPCRQSHYHTEVSVRF